MFWEMLVKLCKRKNVSPNAVAKKIGISNATCTKWKSGVIPNGETLIKLANYFDCSVDYLLGRTENISSHKLHAERINTIMGQYVFRLNVDENFDVNLSNNEIEKIASLQLNYGWKIIKLEEEKGQRFLVLEWVKKGRPDIDPFGSIATKIEGSKSIVAARDTDNSTPIKPNVDGLDNLPTMDEE